MHPILFEIGPVVIRTYGVFIAVAFLVSFLLLYKEAKDRNFYPEKILDLEFLILVSGVIGARALHVLVNLNFYSKNLPDIFLLWRGGLAFYGGLILAIAAAWVFIRKKNLPLWETVDLIAPYSALGQSIGRIGCFLNGCCFGKPASAHFLAVTFPGETVPRQPTQIYASLTLLLIFVILKLARERAPFSGFVFGLALLLYSAQRFFVDFLRADNPTYIFDLTVSQIISVIVFVVALTGLYGRTKR